MRELPAPLVWVVATTANVTAAAFNSRIEADPIAIAMFSLSRLDARAFSVLQACYPAIGVVVGFLLLSDRPAPIELAGVVCVSAAAASAVVRTPVSAGRVRGPGTA